MAKPVESPRPSTHLHVHATVGGGVTGRAWTTPTPLTTGIWISTSKDIRVAFAPGVLGTPDAGLFIAGGHPTPVFFPLADASLLRIRTTKKNTKITVVAA